MEKSERVWIPERDVTWERGQIKNKAELARISGKEVREGHILDLHPSKTLRNGSPSPSQSREVKDTEGEAGEQKCRWEHENENRIEKGS